jgi:hypothetical protein
VEFKRKFNLITLQPGELDLGELLGVGAEDSAYRDGFRMTDGLFRDSSVAKSQRGEADIEVDIQFDIEHSTMSTEPGELTRTFYVPEELAKQTCPMNRPNRQAEMDEKPAEPKMNIQSDTDNLTTSAEPGGLTRMFYVGLGDMPAEPEVDIHSDTDSPAPWAKSIPALSQATRDETVPQANPGTSAQDAQYSPGNTLDMSVGKLDDCFDEFDDIQLDTTEIDHDIDLAFNLPAKAATPSTVDCGMPENARDTMMPDNANTAEADKVPEVILSEVQEDLADDAPALSEERNTGTETGMMSTPDGKEAGEI